MFLEIFICSVFVGIVLAFSTLLKNKGKRKHHYYTTSYGAGASIDKEMEKEVRESLLKPDMEYPAADKWK